MRPATLIAIDCSGEPCSVALSIDGRIVQRISAPGERQSEQLLTWVDALMRETDLAPDRIDGLAVGIGPGGFTGVRLAVAVVQGLALAWQRPVSPISSLAALALAAGPSPLPVLAVLDARMGEVYAGWFGCQEDGSVRALADEQVRAPQHLTAPAGVERYRVLGSGYRGHGDAIDAALGTPVQVLTPLWPCASEVLTLAMRDWPHRAVPPEQLQPAYLRNKVALTSAEQAAARLNR